MARVLCALSGIEFQVEFLPIPIHTREVAHPIFSLDQKRLIHLIGRWSDGSLDSTQSYLLFLALLNSTEQIEWRTPASRTSQTPSIVANNMEQLVLVVGRCELIRNPRFTLPKFSINQETKDLSNVSHWIESWHNCYTEFLSGNRQADLRAKILRREEALEKLIKDHSKRTGSYVRMLADWAVEAGEFPTGQILGIRICDYWKDIIIKCVSDSQIFTIPRADLEELIEHCEDYIPHGTIYAHALMETLRAGLAKQKNYLGLGDLDLSISETKFRVLSADDSVESANIMAMIDSAPISIPDPKDYPNKIAYLKAKMRYDMSVQYKKSSSNGEVQS